MRTNSAELPSAFISRPTWKDLSRALARCGLMGLIILGPVLAVTAIAIRAPAAPATAAVDPIDPGFAQLVAPSAKVEPLKADYFANLEGPVWVTEGRHGYLLISDMGANSIYKWQDGKLSVFMDKAGFTGQDTSAAGVELYNGRFYIIALGPNGLTLDPQGRLLIAQHGDRRVVRRENDGTVTVLADRYNGKRLNSPNDLVVKSNGSLYFTDPAFGLRDGDKSHLKELPGHGVFLVKDALVTLLDNDPQGTLPNGIALSPDERTLYVTASRKLVAYDVRPDDTVANSRVFFDYDNFTKERGGFDGIKVDAKGNIWGVGPGGVWAISPSGKALGRILVPEPTLNLAFGDADGKGLYLTTRRSLYRIRLRVAGGQHKSQ